MKDQKHEDDGLAIVTGAAGRHGISGRRAACSSGLADGSVRSRRRPARGGCHALAVGRARVEVIAGDIAGSTTPPACVAALGERRVRALIHTAGLSPSMADASRIWEVNFAATIRLVDAARRGGRGGCAVLISSMSAHMVLSPEADAAISELGRRTGALPEARE